MTMQTITISFDSKIEKETFKKHCVYAVESENDLDVTFNIRTEDPAGLAENLTYVEDVMLSEGFGQ